MTSSSSSTAAVAEMKVDDVEDDMITGTIDEVEGDGDHHDHYDEHQSSSSISSGSESDAISSRLNDQDRKIDSIQDMLVAILAASKSNGNNNNASSNPRGHSGNSHPSTSSSYPTSRSGPSMFSTPKTTVASAPSVGRGGTIPPAIVNNGIWCGTPPSRYPATRTGIILFPYYSWE